MDHYDFRKAAHFYEGRKPHNRWLVVLHDMEVKNGAKTAENVADLAASGKLNASFHFAIDLNSVVQGVKVGDTAWAAPGANNDGVQFEIAGFARFTRAEWLTKENEDTLNWVAAAVAEVIVVLRAYGVPFEVRHLSKSELLAGKASGIVGHLDVNNAFHKSTHTDPGNGFPFDVFIPKVNWWIGQIKADPKWKPHFV